jgi:Icc protein
MLVAQISDLHVRPVGQSYKDAVDSNRMFADAVEHLNRLDPRPDLVLITGDLVDEGLEAEYVNLRALLARLELPCLLMPGNHDDREVLARCFPDHAYLPAHGPKHFVIDRPPLRIVALDTTVPGDHHGEVDEAGLAWLDAALREAEGAPTLVLSTIRRSSPAFPTSTSTCAGSRSAWPA